MKNATVDGLSTDGLRSLQDALHEVMDELARVRKLRRAEMLRLRAAGVPVRVIAETLGVSEQAVYITLARAEAALVST